MTIRFPRHTAVCSAVCFIILLLAGCSAAPNRDLLWYQDSMTAAVLTEDDSGRVWRITLTEDGFTAALTAPPSVCGIAFTVSETEAYAQAGEVRIPVGEVMLTGARRVVSCLTLSEEDLTGIDPSPEGGVTAHFSRQDAQYDLHLGSDGLPQRMDIQSNGTVYRCSMAVEIAP